MSKKSLIKMMISSLCLAAGMVIRQFSIMIPIMGVGGMRIAFSGIFTYMPAILFGPIYGGAVAGISDILGYIFQPEGGYLPLLSLTAILGGVLRGFVWKMIKNIDSKKFYNILVSFFSILFVFGIINLVVSSYFPESFWSVFLISLSSKGQSQTYFATYIPIFVGAIGVAVLLIYNIKKLKRTQGDLVKLTFMLMFVGIIITTVNTFILMDIYGIKKAFILFYIPRLAEEIAITTIYGYLLSIMLSKTKYVLKKYNL